MTVSVAVAVGTQGLDADDRSNTEVGQSIIGGGCPRCTGWPEELIRARTAAKYWEAMHRRAVEREEKLKKEVETLQAKLRQRERELFARKSERRRKKKSEQLQQNGKNGKKRNRGQQPGAPGHGRGRHDHLPAEPEEHDLAEDQKRCPRCGLPYEPFEGTEDSEVIEVEVRAHRRVIKRKRYKPTCKCPDQPGIITAPMAVLDKPDAFDAAQAELCEAIEQMAADRGAQLADPSLHSVCRKALESLKEHWSGLVLFVEHPEVPMDNNRAEREQRNPVVGRKNYYGSGAVWSGHLAAMLFSLFQTLLLWNINPRVWLTAYLEACAQNGGKAPADAAQWLPCTVRFIGRHKNGPWNLNEEQLRGFQVRSPSPHDTS